MAGIIIPVGSALRDTIEQHAACDRMIFFAGLPGVGKSLMLQQTVLIAATLGRKVSLLQWDVARLAFEQPDLIERYPEVGGVTHAGIRLAAGRWVRGAIRQWAETRTSRRNLLVGEIPLVGNRFVEVARPESDPAEALLAASSATFFIPAPTLQLRREVEAARRREMSDPLHSREAANASPTVLEALMLEIRQLAPKLNIPCGKGEGYDPRLYLAVYGWLLQHRHFVPLWITDFLAVEDSPHKLPDGIEDIVPSSTAVRMHGNALAMVSDDELQARAESWWHLPDVGPAVEADHVAQ
ncbi:MAG: hypothetical protein OXG29_02815 [Gammaproteobacteria bacterium]|nr:hypothetical protein [Gammaproteobacteria bacterium]